MGQEVLPAREWPLFPQEGVGQTALTANPGLASLLKTPETSLWGSWGRFPLRPCVQEGVGLIGDKEKS